jgi:ribulose 1,5-bisphosphate synthetase/thiazole synthase
MGNNGLENFRALDSSEEYDVCIIGSGPSGTVLAKMPARIFLAGYLIPE